MAETNIRVQRFFSQHPTQTEHFVSIELWHPQTGVMRFVANRYQEKMLGIESDNPRDPSTLQPFQPLRMDVARPEQNETPDARISIQLGRVGSQVRSKLKMISDYGYMRQAELVYREHLSDDLSAPTLVYRLSVAAVNMSSGNVSIQAEDDNPVNLNVSRVYTYQDFPGLREI